MHILYMPWLLPSSSYDEIASVIWSQTTGWSKVLGFKYGASLGFLQEFWGPKSVPNVIPRLGANYF